MVLEHLDETSSMQTRSMPGEMLKTMIRSLPCRIHLSLAVPTSRHAVVTYQIVCIAQSRSTKLRDSLETVLIGTAFYSGQSGGVMAYLCILGCV